MEKAKTKDIIAKKMKIGQLAKECDCSRSRIQHYLNIGLLHEPQRIGSTSALYDESHFLRLNQIIQLRKEQKLPLTTIKKILENNSGLGDDGENKVEFHNRVMTILQSKTASKEAGLKEKKEQIIEAAMRVFNKKGYESTSIREIMNYVNKSNSTFYSYFDSKEEFFKECMKRVTFLSVLEEVLENFRKKHYSSKRSSERAIAFLKTFPSHGGMLNLILTALTGDNPELADCARETLSKLTKPIAKDIKIGIADGALKDANTEIVSYLMLGMVEMLGHFLSMNPKCKIEEVNAVMHDFILNGLIKRDDQGKENKKK